jgi:addiction module HigA family antidote
MKKSPPIRPGLVLKRNYLIPNNMSVSDLADKMNVRYNVVNNIISGRGSITPDIALVLPKIFNDTKAEFWINLQSAYDLWYAEGNRDTDEPFYELMCFENEAILKLVGAKKHTGYEAKAVVLKQKSLYPDIMAVPQDPQSNDEKIFIEFQAYTDEMI